MKRAASDGDCPYSTCPDPLLIILSIEETRNVDRVTRVVGLVLVDLCLRRAASDVRHTLEQGAAGRGLGLFAVVLIFWWSNRRRANGTGQYVIAAKQQLIAC